jgi:magnesium chelatase family protein
MVTLEPGARRLLEHAVDRLGLSGRAHDRVLQVALTVRDLSAADERHPTLAESHVAEALSHRALDRMSPAESAAREAARGGRR